MQKVTVELDWDTVDEITVNQLRETYESLKNDLKNRINDVGIAVFVMDKDEDVTLLKEDVAAFERVLSYFGASS